MLAASSASDDAYNRQCALQASFKVNNACLYIASLAWRLASSSAKFSKFCPHTVPKFSKVRRRRLCVAASSSTVVKILRLTADKYSTAAAAAAAAVQVPVNQSIMLLV